MTRPPGAVWVTTRARGGMAGYARALARTTLFRDWRVQHIVTHDDGSPAHRLAVFARGTAALLWRCLGDRPAVVHLHSAAYGSFARKGVLLWLTRGVLRVPTVLHLHAGEFETFYRESRLPVRAFIRATLRRADRVITLAPDLADAVRRTEPRARALVAQNGVAIAPAPRTMTGHAPQVLFLGVLIDRKDPVSLLRAWAAARRPGEARLVFAGDGPLRPDLERLARDLGVQDTVTFAGWVDADQAGALLDASDLLVLPSHHEGQPLSILEAMARGLAIIATRVGGIPDLIEDGVSGLLVPPGDPDRLCDALSALLAAPAARQPLGHAAYARARQQFDLQRTAATLDAVYRDVTATPAPRHPRAPQEPA
ncbi:glycosyltransferase family 4 protein [Deinococcus maricopensis]|uniref:Glycosyl transferase group 1 n=1 Tax=Deinococcus maricopensis (strain DSM 21211 / LMG 22137 / NRRL B-23946 / LB-34) TaxID=709986 RepID=E8U3F1_DEIML|nr:glycosyltransferase family 4 protein [Deinococcus maricopensis]ADV65822.1 glycosyl transferase group 1 [Deinococcus maricopensis DSM 21211]